MVQSMKLPTFSRRQAIALLGLSTLGATEQVEVDLALVLAIDCSFSVSASEYKLQMQGLGRALMNPQVFEAIERGPKAKIALSAFLWSEAGNRRLILPWKIISSAADAFSTGSHMIYTGRDIAPGGTSISSAMLYARTLLGSAPPALRRVVDVSTDGRNNSGFSTRAARSQLLAENITINALAIINEVQTLDIYLENQVAGGEGSFVMKVNDYESYGEAMLKKLVKEITGPGIS
jgi:Protein of unknown function (DUF1194)